MINPAKSTFYDQLEIELTKMTPRTRLYRILKTYLKSAGYWKDQPRGNPSKGRDVAQGHGTSEGNSGGYTESDF